MACLKSTRTDSRLILIESTVICVAGYLQRHSAAGASSGKCYNMESEASTIKVRIRGIYSQSLAQILLQNHFEIVQPSPDVARRFGLPFRDAIPDIDIWDRSDLQGIVAIAYESLLSKLAEILRRRLGWIITRTPRVAKSSIYKGKVIGKDKRTGQMKVDLGKIYGLLPEKGTKPDSYRMVQVRAHDYGRKSPVLSTNITIPGKVAVLLPEPVVRISTKIKDESKRQYLTALGKKLRQHTEGWGILWRTAAAKLTERELRDGVDDLLDVSQKIYADFEKTNDPGRLFEGTSNADIEFPAEVKKALDETRGKIRSTMKHHHFYKSANYSPLVDFAELIIEERPEEREYMTSKLERVVSRDMPRVNDSINIEHVKLDGRNIVLSRGLVTEVNTGSLTIRRKFRYTNRKLKLNRKRSEDVDVSCTEGDYAVTKVVPGAQTLITKYYSRDGRLKGAYVNLNTAIEVYPSNSDNPSRVRYIDLEIDIVNPINEEARIIDQHLLKRAVERGFITERMADTVERKAKAIYEGMKKKNKKKE
jgi:probable ribonuclease FAU-1